MARRADILLSLDLLFQGPLPALPSGFTVVGAELLHDRHALRITVASDILADSAESPLLEWRLTRTPSDDTKPARYEVKSGLYQGAALLAWCPTFWTF